MPVYLPGLTFGGLGYGGSSYGYSPYGSAPHARLLVPTTGGYGGAPYGLASYGSVDITPPGVTGAQALDGFRVEVFFSEEMRDDAALVDPDNYTFTQTYGVPLVAVSVEPGTEGDLDGFTSVIVTHTGSTLGGNYVVHVSGIYDVAGNVMIAGTASFVAFGDATQVVASLPDPDDGHTVILDFQDSRDLPQDMLTEAEFSPGVDSVASYEISTDYPIEPTINSATQSVVELSRVELDVSSMTSIEYDFVAGPATAYLYNGAELPTDDPNLAGAVTGTGTSVASESGLVISKALAVTYGWILGDTSGRIVAGSTYRADFELDFTSATIAPPVTNTTLLTLSVGDGAVQVNLILNAIAGNKVIDIVSGTYTAQLPAEWGGNVILTLLRNQHAGFYSLLLDGVPLLTFPIASANGAPAYPSGTSVVFGPSHSVATFLLRAVNLTASSTLFTSSWNFLHNVPTTFLGSAVLTNDRVRTRYGPLVRGWGDATPATILDVGISIDGTDVNIGAVNPYVGEIFPTIPIPLTAPGSHTIEVDYVWVANPVFPLAGLNTPGLVLNAWTRPGGPAAGRPSVGTPGRGVAPTNRFPYSVVLGPMTRPSPKLIGHRYIGFQKDYSALLNSPTTLLLNQNPHAISVGGLKASALRERGVFNGRTTPPEASTPWELEGIDGGGVVGDGSYEVIDDSTGPYGIGEASVYYRNLDLSFSTAVVLAARFRVSSYTLDGVFTGVGFGVHDGGHLLLVGLLVVDGVQHVGVLLDGSKTYLEEGWDIGPALEATAISQTALRLNAINFPPGFEVGSRFRIPAGPQAGVYAVSECGLEEVDSEIEVSFTPELPEDIAEYGNDAFEILLETLWGEEDPISLRAHTGFPRDRATSVYLGGRVSGLIAQLDDLPAFPAQTALLLPAIPKGVAFWGSISRRAMSASLWDFVSYDSNPERLTQTVQGITALTEMNVVPEEDPNDPWYVVGDFGFAYVDSSGLRVVLKSTSSSSTIDEEFSYARVEPYLTPKRITDAEASFQIESGILGAGDVELRIQDSVRTVSLKTLLYADTGAVRELVTDLPQISLSGLQDPETVGWTKTGGMSDPFVRGQTLQFTKASSETGLWSSEALVDPSTATYEGYILEARLSVTEGFVSGTVGIGVLFGCKARAGGVVRSVGVILDAGEVSLVDMNNAIVDTYVFDWGDEELHDYRIVIDPNANMVTVLVDGTSLGGVAFTDFASQATVPPYAFLGGVGDGEVEFTLDSMSVIPLRPIANSGSALGRTFGILLRGGDPDDIDGYRIPRSDATAAPNSSTTAIPVPMDWRTYCNVRLLLDPNWGVSFYRPDLPPPPGASGNYTTQTTDPTGAWATVEYRSLPVQKTDRGFVNFGSIDPRSISQSRWDFVRYRIRGATDGFGIAPQGMVLNRAFTFTSGEFNRDVTPEVETIISRTSTLVYVPDSAIYADRVFVVQVDGAVVPSTSWGFDKASQNLIFNSPLPTKHHSVTVTFAPGRPITQTYLCGQPIEASGTLLNSGTPSMIRSLSGATTSSVVAGTPIVDPDDDLDPAESGVVDPYEYLTHTDDPSSVYANVSYCEVEDGDDVHISTLCDGPGPGLGLAEIAIEGQFTSAGFTLTGGPGGRWGGQSPVIAGSSARFSSGSVMYLSGGRFSSGGSLNTAIMYPNARGANWAPNTSGMGMNQDFVWVLVDVDPREDTFDLSGIMGDNVPPSSADPTTDPNPNGTPGLMGHGAAAYIMEDYGSSPFSRLGPWGGMTLLNVRSLLAGGAQLDGTEFVLQGGAGLPLTTITTSGVIEAAN